MTDQDRARKPGPQPDRLKIELDPAEALRRLLTKEPADNAQDGGDESEPEGEEADRD